MFLKFLNYLFQPLRALTLRQLEHTTVWPSSLWLKEPRLEKQSPLNRHNPHSQRLDQYLRPGHHQTKRKVKFVLKVMIREWDLDLMFWRQFQRNSFFQPCCSSVSMKIMIMIRIMLVILTENKLVWCWCTNYYKLWLISYFCLTS